MTFENQTPTELAGAIFASLVGQRLADKYIAIEWLDDQLATVDQTLLRSMLVKAINNEFKVGRERSDNDPSIADTRSWVVSALGRLTAGDDSIAALVLEHVKPDHEPTEGGRYWALEGLIKGKSSSALKAASMASAPIESDLQVSSLGYAYLAEKGDPQALDTIKKRFADPTKRGAVIRALRAVLLPFAIDDLCGIVEAARYNSETYDAIVAVGRLTQKSKVPRVAQALSTAIVSIRGTPWMDGMRSTAIAALGNLQVEGAGSLLCDELLDHNPSIVRQAARSLEKVLGLSVAVSRIVDAATRSKSASSVDAFARGLRWMKRDAVAEELEGLMSAGSSAQQDVARTLLGELGGVVAFEKLRVRTESLKQYSEMLERAEVRVRELFEKTIHDAQQGFYLATAMDVAVFGIGVALVIFSAFEALRDSNAQFAAWAGVGGVGVLGTLYGLFVSNPRQRVRDSVDHLMRVKIVFLSYLRRLHQADQAYTTLLLERGRISPAELKGYTDLVGAIMSESASGLTSRTP